MQREMDLFQAARQAKQVTRVNGSDFKEALLSGELAGMVNEVVAGEAISGPGELYNILAPLMSQHPTIEKFYCIFLNAKNRILSIDAAFSGSLTSCAVYPREIMKACLDRGAAALILAHNHPSGETTPSGADESITKRILAAGQVMGVAVHEHIICGRGDYHSMAGTGFIAQAKAEMEGLF